MTATTDIPPILHDKATAFKITDEPFGIPITIESRGDGNWVILLGSMNCMSKGGELGPEPMPSSRSEMFLSDFRYDLDTAVELCNEYNLWDAKWENGAGYVSDKFNMSKAKNWEGQAWEGFDL